MLDYIHSATKSTKKLKIKRRQSNKVNTLKKDIRTQSISTCHAMKLKMKGYSRKKPNTRAKPHSAQLVNKAEKM